MAKGKGNGWATRTIFRVCAGAMFLLVATVARATAPAPQDAVEAVWQPHNMAFEYRGYTTLYSCRTLQDKLRKILLHLGARQPPELRAYACDEATGTVRFQVMFESPLEATAENVRQLTDYDARELLIARTRGESLQTAQDVERFPAAWKTVSFASDRKLGLGPGDCDLVQQLRRQILPRMSVQVLRSRSCSTFGNATKPGMTVSALVAQ